MRESILQAPGIHSSRRSAAGPPSSPPTRVAFADESGTTSGTKCYAIGVVSLDRDKLPGFDALFEELRRRHGVRGEVKWTSIHNSHGQVNLALDWLDKVLSSQTGKLDVMVVHKRRYRKWSAVGADRERAFYVTYTFLLKKVAEQARGTLEVSIDDRSDHYPKHHEAVEKIANNMLSRLHARGELAGVRRAKSVETPGIQVADLLTGAICAAHQRRLDPKAKLNRAKAVAIERLAEMLGWDDLCYDTMPHSKVNIWHFPIEYRADPQTRLVVPAKAVRYVSAADLLAA